MNCIDAACAAACETPQYIVLRTPTLLWRPYPHVMTCRDIEGVANYHPREGDRKTWLGYDGITDAQDHGAPGVWTPWRLVAASWLFALGVTLWRVKRLVSVDMLRWRNG